MSDGRRDGVRKGEGRKREGVRGGGTEEGGEREGETDWVRERKRELSNV